MGQSKDRQQSSQERVDRIAQYVCDYQHKLRELMLTLPTDDVRVAHSDGVVAIGRYEVWPCIEGAVVLGYRDANLRVSVTKHPPLKMSVNDFLAGEEASTYFHPDGKPIAGAPPFKVTNARNLVAHVANNAIVRGEVSFKPRYQRLSVFGWDAHITAPDLVALTDFQTVIARRNLAAAANVPLDSSDRGAIALGKAKQLLRDFKALIQDAGREEELQRFLTKNPDFLYPDHIEQWPKFKLGNDYVTDFVVLVQGIQGREYVFVEIEKASKPLFTQAGHFTAEFTQAKDQLLNWDNWITRNHAYIAAELLQLHKPSFHLVMGRDKGTQKELKDKLLTEFIGSSRRFSTYDDLANRFEQIVVRLSKL